MYYYICIMKTLNFNSKEFVEGVVAATIDFYEQANGPVDQLSHKVEERDNIFKINVFAPIGEISVTEPDGFKYVEDYLYAEDTITLYPHERVSSFIDDLSTSISDIHDKLNENK